MSYTIAKILNILPQTNGSAQLDIEHTGLAGETPVITTFTLTPSSSPPGPIIRAEVMRQQATLNNRNVLFDQFRAQLPYTLDTTTPLPTPPANVPMMSYMAASVPFTPGATPQDVFTITGSATKTITVVAMGIATVQTTAGINGWSLAKRSTANTGGTSAAVNAVPTTGSFDAATATVLSYTGNPTAGTLVGRVWSGRIPSPAPASSGLGDANVSPVSPNRVQPITLNGVNEVLAWNFGGAALPAGLSVTAWVSWIESV